MNIKSNFIVAVLMTVVTTALLGIGYPLVMTALAQAMFPDKANDQLVARNGTLVGSRKKLADAVKAAVEAERKDNPSTPIPIDLVTSSASGLDPHVSPAAALFQVPRVARARGVSERHVRRLVESRIEDRQWGLFGEPRVNVLELNLALDEQWPAKK